MEMLRLICDLKISKNKLTNEYTSFKKTHIEQNSNIEEYMYVNLLNYNLCFFNKYLITSINNDHKASIDKTNHKHYHSPEYMTKWCFDDAARRLNKVNAVLIDIAVKVLI
jgi:hypothetical protein